MTQEEKQLLFKDLCARLPYHLLGRDAFGKTREMKVIYPTETIIAQEIDGECCSSCGFIPYLRPMSSMTEGEQNECINLIDIISSPSSESDKINKIIDCLNENIQLMDWFNKHNFDYRGLIDKGLALEAPEGMYKF